MIIGLTVNDSIAPAGNHMGELRSIADRDIRPRLLSISGVSQVSVIGGDVSEYQILLNPALMKNSMCPSMMCSQQPMLSTKMLSVGHTMNSATNTS